MNDDQQTAPIDPAFLALAKAIYAVGFSHGHRSGSDAATAYEWGSRSQEPQDAEKSWEHHVQWMLESEHSRFDVTKPEGWNSAY